MSETTATVRRFIEAWKTRDLDRIMSFFSDDCVYHNIPVDPVQGTAAIRAVIQELGAKVVRPPHATNDTQARKRGVATPLK